MNFGRKPTGAFLGVTHESSLVPSDLSAAPSKAPSESSRANLESSAASVHAKVPLSKLSPEELLQECENLLDENAKLRQQLQRKEEQRLTAVRLLKQAKKKQEQQKLGEVNSMNIPETAKNILGQGFEKAPSIAPPPSITCSIMSIGKRGLYSHNLRTAGLKELVNPDADLVEVLEKLSSAPVLGVLQRLVDQLETVANEKPGM